ncbi:MAG: hypothetical protein K9J74_11630, partial [Sulfuritalea sp.]|nr:hypothetical protein [Sulfuritalea sp.]
MSLVNKMLRDLDARRAGDGERAVLPAAVTPMVARRESRQSPLWWWLISIMALVVAGAIAWLGVSGSGPEMPAAPVLAVQP